MKQIDERMFVAGQLRPEDMAAAAAQGMRMIVNNRPDGEEPDQPAAADIESAARKAGLDYVYIPVAGGFSQDQIAAMAQALEQSGGRTLAFCRTGTRSTFLWALARRQAGEDGTEIMRKAEAAGYDLTPIAGHLLAAG